jgi:hypothetical protein
MAALRRCVTALAILTAVSSAGWAASNARMKFAAPAAQEETIYRPDCPSEETSSTWLQCRVAGASGG